MLRRGFCLALVGWCSVIHAAGPEAPSPDWWSLQPLVRPTVPIDHEADGNPIDAFIRARLAEKGLQPSPPADPRTLIRRLYFDLIGLPPTPEEVEAFVEECRTSSSLGIRHSSFSALVDRLLASPRYGERWARHWLDVVHYGDTHGYDKDKPRQNAWPYRDYVIRAFNVDKPYSRFVQEQIAGDVLFPGTRDGIEALGFIAAGPWDFIGHTEVPESKIDGQIARHLDRDDMVMNTFQTFTSLTVQCAQCHDHKFDPITQEDYYRTQAVFAALDRTELKYYADDEQNARFRDLQRRQLETSNTLAALEAPLKQRAGERLTALDRQLEGASTRASKKQGNARPDFGYHSAIATAQEAVKWVQVDLGKRVDIDRVTLLPCYDDYNSIGAGFGFPVRFKVEASDDPEFQTGVTLLWRKHDATFMNDFPNPGLQLFTTGGAKDDGIRGRYVRVTVVKLAPRKNDFIFALAELQVFDPTGSNVAQGQPVSALDSIEAPPRWRRSNLTDGIAPERNSPDERVKLLADREALLLEYADHGIRTRLKVAKGELQTLARELAAFPKPNLVYAGGVHTGSGNFVGTGLSGGKPRPIHLLNRGDVKRPAHAMEPGAISGLPSLSGQFALPPGAPEGERRAALAQWLTDPANPLPWRSIVNRVWQQHFGRGLVETPNDFGRMGALPTHPELLDWLAVTLRDDFGGSLKQLHQLIVTSATYRQASSVTSNQSSVISPARSRKLITDAPITDYFSRAATVDPDNRLLWRQNRRKLDAESVRDSVLFVSGRLDLRMGGPAFQDFVIEKPEHSPHYQYHLHDPDDPGTHRRSIYRFIVRSQLQPFMTALDCADPSIQVGKRNESLSALQSLALLNDGLMITMAKHFATKLDADDGSLHDKVNLGFREALARAPTQEEQGALADYAKQHGLTNACRLLFNLSEFTFVD